MLEQPYFGQRLKSLRLQMGLTQAAVAGDKMSTGYLSRLEAGSRVPSPRIVKYLASRLSVPLSAFDTLQPSLHAQVLTAMTMSSTGEDVLEPLDAAVRADKGKDLRLRWQALWLLASRRESEGRHRERHDLLAELVGLSEALGIAELQARTHTQLSRCLRILGDNAGAREHAAAAVELSRDLSLTDRAMALQELVATEAEAGRLIEARTHAADLCRLTEEAPAPLFAKALWASATVHSRLNDHAAALDALERAMDTVSSEDDLQLWMRLQLAAASLYLQSDPPLTGKARARLDEVAPAVKLVGGLQGQQELLALQAHLAFADNRVDDARELCERLGTQELTLSFRDRVRIQALSAKLLILDGKVDDGIARLRELAQRADEAHNIELAVELWRGVAETLARAHSSVEPQ
ncbi:helix-turn-helix domain-containing protein [Microbispora bryophytorum]|uniref:helix-turn-helix domain-containing protein n=1 Tax=Microbispora bryophytorum TaxID=1460882 RepID=UPI00371463AE